MRKIFVFLLILFLFGLRVSFLPRLDLKDGWRVRVSGVLSEEPQISQGRQRIKIGQFEAWVDRYPEFHYPDEVELVGKVKTRPLITLNLPLPSFKFPLTSFNRYLVEVESIKGIKSIKGTTGITGGAMKLKMSFLNVFNQIFPRPYDGIVSGIVLGDKSLISKDFWQKMQRTGTLHIMVASGMNIAMFSKGVLSFFTLFFKRRMAILCLLCVIWFYSIMTGLAPPMVRAATLASLIYLSQVLGRETEGGRVLILTGMLMVFVNPLVIFDVGFQLSFLATAGLVWIEPKFKILSTKSETNSNDKNSNSPNVLNLKHLNLVYFVSNCSPLVKNSQAVLGHFDIRISNLLRSDNFTSSISAQLATLPILVVNFGQLNLLSPFINLLILWTVLYILQLGMLLGLLGLLWISGAKLASNLVFPLLFYLEQAVNLTAKVKIFQLELPKLGWWWAVGYYLVLGMWVKNKDKNLTPPNDPLKSSKISVKGKLKER